MHRFNICLVVLSLSCSGVKTPYIRVQLNSVSPMFHVVFSTAKQCDMARPLDTDGPDRVVGPYTAMVNITCLPDKVTHNLGPDVITQATYRDLYASNELITEYVTTCEATGQWDNQMNCKRKSALKIIIYGSYGALNSLPCLNLFKTWKVFGFGGLCETTINLGFQN